MYLYFLIEIQNHSKWHSNGVNTKEIFVKTAYNIIYTQVSDGGKI